MRILREIFSRIFIGEKRNFRDSLQLGGRKSASAYKSTKPDYNFKKMTMKYSRFSAVAMEKRVLSEENSSEKTKTLVRVQISEKRSRKRNRADDPEDSACK